MIRIRMAAALAAICLTFPEPILAQQAGGVEMPAWLSGTWEAESRSGPHVSSWVVETWSQPRGETMLGTGLSGLRAGNALTGEPADFVEGFEFMRIARDADGGLVLHGSPGGTTAVAFRLIRSGVGEVVFENSSHDYPQRISYRREGDILTATISLIDSTRAQSRTYFRR